MTRYCHECTYCYTRPLWRVHKCGASRPPHREIDPDDKACEEFLDIMEVGRDD
jgi:hypothetical protein